MTVASTACSDIPFSTNPAASAHSRFVQRIRRRYADQLQLLPPGAPLRATMQLTLDALLESGLETGAALRVLRQLVLERLVVLDCDSQQAHTPATADITGIALQVVTGAMTDLAELALDVAMRHSRETLDALHGAPLTEAGTAARMWVVGMGKLGARELNVSSDIDLILRLRPGRRNRRPK